MNTKQIFIAVLIAAALILAYSSMYTVNEREIAIKFQFGKIEDVSDKPGLYFKIPWYNVTKYERRILMLDARPTEYLTQEKKKLVVDFFAKWRIKDIKTYYRTMSQGDIDTARMRIFNIINDGLKSQFSQYSLTELVSGEKSDPNKRRNRTSNSPAEIAALTSDNANNATTESAKKEDIRTKVMNAVIKQANEVVEEKYGITIVDIRIKRIDLTKKISKDVFARMRSEREQFAAEIRSSGKQRAEEMKADADKQRTIILAEAYQKAQEIRGKGDADAAEIYANAYNQDREFYAFYRSLDAYKKAFAGQNDILVIEPNSDFFNYFKQNKSK